MSNPRSGDFLLLDNSFAHTTWKLHEKRPGKGPDCLALLSCFVSSVSSGQLSSNLKPWTMSVTVDVCTWTASKCSWINWVNQWSTMNLRFVYLVETIFGVSDLWACWVSFPTSLQLKCALIYPYMNNSLPLPLPLPLVIGRQNRVRGASIGPVVLLVYSFNQILIFLIFSRNF